jgi:hypothetical protein
LDYRRAEKKSINDVVVVVDDDDDDDDDDDENRFGSVDEIFTSADLIKSDLSSIECDEYE